MRYEIAKQIVLYYGNIFVMQKMLRKEKNELENEYSSLHGIAIDGLPHGGAFVSSTEQAGIRAAENNFCDRISEIERRERILEEDAVKIRSCLDSLNGRYKKILEVRYLHRYSWVKISMQIYQPESTVRRWHQKALERLGEVLEAIPDIAELAERASRARP